MAIHRQHLLLNAANQKTLFLSAATFTLGLALIHYFGMHHYVAFAWAASFLAVLVMFRSMHSMAMYYRCALPVIIGLFAIMLYVESHQWELAKKFYLDIPHSDFHGENYYAVISTLYALITALVLIKGIETFDQLNGAINDEANKIQSIMEYLEYFDDANNPEARTTVGNIKVVFLDYAINVLNQENVAGCAENYKTLRRCAVEVSRLNCRDENDKIALGKVMNGLNDLGGIRTTRISCAIARIPLYLIIATGIMSMAIIIPFFRENPDVFNQNYVMIFMMSAFGSFLLLMLLDINTPFDGFWRVDLSIFEDLRRAIQSDIDQG